MSDKTSLFSGNASGDGDGTLVTATFANFTDQITPTSTSAILRLTVASNSGTDEEWAIDNISLGDGAAIPEASQLLSFSIVGLGSYWVAKRRRHG
jgi:hypothetical protein